jgi:pilus assembly protein Flp/PilA
MISMENVVSKSRTSFGTANALGGVGYGLVKPRTYKFEGGNKEMKNLLKRLWQEEEGQDLVEYGLLLVLIALAATAAMGTLASAISNAFKNASANLSSS